MKTIKLNNGVDMPLEGFGVFQIAPDACEAAVLNALETGYRMIDTAQAYYNEEGVGRALNASGLPREDIFLVTKVWISNAGEEKAAASIDASLAKLQSDYIDLLLIENMEIKPAVVQLETHVFSQQQKMRKLMEPYGTRLMAWAPLAEGQHGIFTNPTLSEIAAKHGKSIAQVALRFLMHEDIITIPKSVRRERQLENLSIEDFELTQEEIEVIRALDGGKPLMADFNNPELARFLLEYDSKFNPDRR